jgi:erythromycin esterase-like protein
MQFATHLFALANEPMDKLFTVSPVRRDLFTHCLALVCLVALSIFAPLRAQSAFSTADQAQLDQLVGDLCQKQVVFLGEDNNHGAARTVDVKTQLLNSLVDRCGFSAVFFESGLYDFVDLEQRVKLRTVTPAQIADAIGSVWSATAEGDVLVASLHQRVRSKGLRLLGLDLQTGSASSFYQQTRFAKELTAKLSNALRADCTARIARHLVWGYDEKVFPYDAAAIAQLNLCATDAIASYHRHSDKTWQVLADNFAESLRLATLPSAEQARLRDFMMYENFKWHRARLPPGAKVIVWTASVHAIKQRSSANAKSVALPFGAYVHQALGAKSAVVGFSALQGAYSPMNRGEARQIAVQPDFLEAQLYSDYDASIRYVGAKQLQAFGAVQALALSYAKPDTEQWSQLMDALIVLRAERPVRVVHPRGPQQSE